MSQPIRIIIADDHPIVRDGLVAILGTQPDFEVVGEVADGAALVECVAAFKPDVVLTDLEMPGMDGVNAIKHIQDRIPGTRVIVLTIYDTDDRIINSIKAGARGYLLKGAPRNDIFTAIRTVFAGGSLLHPIATSKLLEHMRSPDGVISDQLTDREMDVLRHLVLGMTNREIAAGLDITERTVKFHVSAIIGKLGAGNRTEAVTIAVQRGIVTI